jgi:hypothetical protein
MPAELAASEDLVASEGLEGSAAPQAWQEFPDIRLVMVIDMENILTQFTFFELYSLFLLHDVFWWWFGGCFQSSFLSLSS